MKSIGRQKKKAEEQPTCTVSTWDIYKSLLFLHAGNVFGALLDLANYFEGVVDSGVCLGATSCIVEQVIFIKGCWLTCPKYMCGLICQENFNFLEFKIDVAFKLEVRVE